MKDEWADGVGGGKARKHFKKHTKKTDSAGRSLHGKGITKGLRHRAAQKVAGPGRGVEGRVNPPPEW